MHENEVYVRFSETDAAGHVNNTSYFLYLEEARTKFFNELGYRNEESIARVNLILASTKCDYVAQAYAGQILKVATEVIHIGNKSFTVNHVITVRDTGEVIARATATLVSFDYVEQRTIPIPNEVRANLEHFLITQ
ncbi:acyl-CoA thioesterase [Bacillus andreraoultii]|uniref:acyl-CoA thioesterase n=1 Tax=Bacillus andreraoultii TaxID=1499685 RepID=UPI000539B25F|nr:thioesterase family protein [Bacillus andreraoultii]